MGEIIRPISRARYYLAGVPFEFVANKSKPGEMRKVTIADVRKAMASPSVTTITGVLAEEGLNVWKSEQLLMSALTFPETPEVTDLAERAQLIYEDSMAQVGKAAEWGNRADRAFKHYLETGTTLDADPDDPKDFQYFMEPLYRWADANIESLISANKIVMSDLGFAGTSDVFAKMKNGRRTIFDLKSRDIKHGRKMEYWPKWAMQVCGYKLASGEEDIDVGNVVVGRNVQLAEHYIWKEDEVARYTLAFEACFVLWQCMNKIGVGGKDAQQILTQATA